jgi:hypothetical protein
MAEARKEEVVEAWTNEFHAQDKAAGAGAATRQTNLVLRQRWTSVDKIHCVCGSSLLSDLSAWSKKEFGVSISDIALARELRQSEMAPELVGVLTAIERHDPFPASARAKARAVHPTL